MFKIVSFCMTGLCHITKVHLSIVGMCCVPKVGLTLDKLGEEEEEEEDWRLLDQVCVAPSKNIILTLCLLDLFYQVRRSRHLV
jgi:hypothetical protein